jgi:hypothetical protein
LHTSSIARQYIALALATAAKLLASAVASSIVFGSGNSSPWKIAVYD